MKLSFSIIIFLFFTFIFLGGGGVNLCSNFSCRLFLTCEELVSIRHTCEKIVVGCEELVQIPHTCDELVQIPYTGKNNPLHVYNLCHACEELESNAK